MFTLKIMKRKKRNMVQFISEQWETLLGSVLAGAVLLHRLLAGAVTSHA